MLGFLAKGGVLQRSHLGGRGIATRIYWENVEPEVNALDPENHLILMTGPLCAAGAKGVRDSKLLASRECDTKTGLQKAETLERLDLSDVAQDLKGRKLAW